MNRRTKIIIPVVVACLLVVAAFVAYRMHRWRVGAEALVSRGGQKQLYPDGRGVEIITAGNVYDETTVVLVLHCSTIDPDRRVLSPGRVYSSNDPVDDLKSSYRLTTHYPPDPAISGLWLDGSKRKVGNGLTVVYISDRHAATDISILHEKQPAFVADAGELDPLQFIQKWVEPRVRDNHQLQLTGDARD